MKVPGRDAEGFWPNPPNSGRLHDLRHRSGRKTLVQSERYGDLAVRRQATWGMSGQDKVLETASALPMFEPMN